MRKHQYELRGGRVVDDRYTSVDLEERTRFVDIEQPDSKFNTFNRVFHVQFKDLQTLNIL